MKPRRSPRLAAFLLVGAFWFAMAGPVAAAGSQVALVVGNANYQHLTRLTNPASDAKLIARTLKSLGFELIGGGEQLDVDKRSFERLIRQFGQSLSGDAVAVFYYAGHGVQVQGANYLVPVEANPVSAADVDFELIDAGLALKQMEGAGSRLNMMILDACRNNPFGGRGLRDTGSGLAVMRAPRGTVISYATQPGNVARDGSDGNSPYTRALAAAMVRPGSRVLDVFNEVGLAVDKATRGEQQPWVASSPIEGDFSFVAAAAPVTPIAAPAPAALPADAELVFWQSIAASSNPADFEAYLKAYPDGRFAALARNRLALAAPAPARSPPAKSPPEPTQRPPRPSAAQEQCAAAHGSPGIRRYCVSSALPALVGDRSGASSYLPAHLFDGNPATAWAAARGQGEPQWVLVEFDGERSVAALRVANGYQKSDTTFRNNHRIRRLRLIASSGDSAVVTLPDRKSAETVALDRPLHGAWLQLVIDDLYPGARDPDVTLSEVQPIFSAPAPKR